MEICYDGALVMPKNYAVVDEEEMTYVDGGVSAKVRWYGVDIHYTSRDLQGFVAACATGGGAAWLAAELHAPTTAPNKDPLSATPTAHTYIPLAAERTALYISAASFAYIGPTLIPPST